MSWQRVVEEARAPDRE